MIEILTAHKPPDWQLFRLGQVFEERKAKASDKDFAALSVTMRGIVPQLETAAKTDDGDNRKLVRKGDYVINSRSDRKGSSGLSRYDGTVSLISIVLKPRAGIIPEFAHHLLRCAAFQEEFYRMGHGIVADLWTTRFSELKNIRVHLPDLPTQKRIAAFLDRETARIDTLIAKKERLVEVLKSRFDAMVRDNVTKSSELDGITLRTTGIDYLGDIPTHWSVEKVGWRYSIQLGKMLDASKQTGLHKKPYLRVADVQWDAVNSTDLPTMDYTLENQKKFRIETGDLLVNEGGSYVGRSAIWRGASGEVFYQKALHRLRPLNSNRDSSEFMLWLMWFATKEGIFVANGNQTTIDHLTAEAFKAYRFGFPPLEEQKKIATLLRKERDISAELEGRVNASINRLREYRAALITAAVTGQIDVDSYTRTGIPSATLDRIEGEMQG